MNACDLKGKAIVFLGDGMADLPIPELDGKTPLEAVPTPTMDKIAANGASGTFLTLPEGYPTSSDVANMSVLGYAPSLYQVAFVFQNNRLFKTSILENVRAARPEASRPPGLSARAFRWRPTTWRGGAT